MPTYRETISSNETDLLIAEEVTPGKLPTDPGTRWRRGEPNSYTGFGSETNTVARRPINRNRRTKKGTPVGMSASGGYESDLTYANLQEDLQGFCFSNIRDKSEVTASAVAVDGFVVPDSGDEYVPGTLLFAKGAKLNTNSGLFVADADSTETKIAVVGALTASAGEAITVSRVGVEGAAGDIEMIVTTGGFPALVSTVLDFTTLGVGPGEFLFVGGDAVGTRFATDACNGWGRVYSVEAHQITLDKTDAEVAADDDGATKTIRIFFGRTLRDEDAALQVARSYSLRRLMGAPDLDDKATQQSEVLTGAVASEFTLSVPEEDKLTATLEYIARDHVQFEDDSDIPGTIVEIVEADAINSTRDSVRARMAVYADGNSAPLPLFPVFTDFEFSVNNNLSENKGVTRYGAVSVEPGIFEVTLSATAYFSRVAAIKAVRDNADVTFDFCVFKGNQGIAIDLPLLSISTDGAEVEPDSPITISVDGAAAGGAKYNRAMSHTICFTFFDYLPNIAGETVI